MERLAWVRVLFLRELRSLRFADALLQGEMCLATLVVLRTVDKIHLVSILGAGRA